MAEFTKGKLEIFFQDGKLYLECDTPMGKVRLAEMAMGHRTDSVADAEELVHRWNGYPDLKQQRDDLRDTLDKIKDQANRASMVQNRSVSIIKQTCKVIFRECEAAIKKAQ